MIAMIQKNNATCIVCSSAFFRKNSRVLCCSQKCGYLLRSMGYAIRKRRNTISCLQCGIEFVKKHRDQIYCGHRCHALQSQLGRFSEENYVYLVKYYADGGINPRYSTDGKGLTCKQCGRHFDAHPHKIRCGKALFCSQACYDEARHNPHRSENEKLRGSPEYRIWRTAVFVRDDYTCQACLRRGGRLHAHHVLLFSEYPELRLDLENGLTLCILCHDKIHHRKGKRHAS